MKKQEKVSRMMGSRNAGTGLRKNSRVKKTGFRITGRQILLIILLLSLFMGSGIGFVWSNFERTQIGYDLSQLKNEELRLKEINRKLTLELAFLKSPAHLEAQAVSKLGMKTPKPEQIIVLP